MQKTYWKLNFSKLKYAIFLSAGLCPAPRQGSRPGPKGQTSNQFARPLAGPDSGQSHRTPALGLARPVGAWAWPHGMGGRRSPPKNAHGRVQSCALSPGKCFI